MEKLGTVNGPEYGLENDATGERESGCQWRKIPGPEAGPKQ